MNHQCRADFLLSHFGGCCYYYYCCCFFFSIRFIIYL